MKKLVDMMVGCVHMTNHCGSVEVLEYVNCKKVKVLFKNTGNTLYFSAANIRAGKACDFMAPTVCGVGYLGKQGEQVTIGGVKVKAYMAWSNMLKRCYSEKSLISSPEYAGCSVCEEWHNYQEFKEWFNSNFVDGLQLDKDIIKEGNREYSPSTCKFVTAQENSEKANAKTIELISPNGDFFVISNLMKFCRENGLNHPYMCSVSTGKKQQYKGWTKA